MSIPLRLETLVSITNHASQEALGLTFTRLSPVGSFSRSLRGSLTPTVVSHLHSLSHSLLLRTSLPISEIIEAIRREPPPPLTAPTPLPPSTPVPFTFSPLPFQMNCLCSWLRPTPPLLHQTPPIASTQGQRSSKSLLPSSEFSSLLDYPHWHINVLLFLPS